MLFTFQSQPVRIDAECRFENTRSGFKHVCTMIPTFHGVTLDNVTCTRYYINRTWEKYEFQSALLSAIDKLLESATTEHKEAFKVNRGYQIMTKKRLAEFNALKPTPVEQALKAIRDEIKRR